MRSSRAHQVPADAAEQEDHEMDRVRWGILSTADIGMRKVTPAIQRAEACEVVAIASRDEDRAAAAAAELGIPASYGSYEELLAAEDVDAVYIPLPNDLHAPWTLHALAAGKHVLCEKPLALTAEQASEMATAADTAGRKLGEAFMYRHHPSWVEAVRLVRGGAIGELQAVQSWFSYHNDDPQDIRNRVENGGGAIMDIGCYSIHLSRLVFGAEPTEVHAAVRRDPVMGIDTLSSATLVFPGGGQASFTCSTRAEPDQRVHIVGDRGRIDIEIPFNIPPDRETRIAVSAGGDPPVAPDTEVVTFDAADAYMLQAAAFARAILDDTDTPAPITDAIANMRVIDAILGTA
jgi:predicted dehydrogenase